MRIGIDGGSWSNRRGYGRFLREMAKALSAAPIDHQYVLFLDRAGQDQFTHLNRFETRVVPLSQSISEAASNAGNRSLLDLARMGRAVARERFDVFFFPTVYSYFPLWNGTPSLVGIHDTIADRNPQFAFAGKRQELFWKAKVRLAIRSATLVMTVSEYSCECLENFYHVPRAKIRIVSEAASPQFHASADRSQRERFVLYVGGISPNKNLSTLIQAFALTQARSSGWRLLLAGDYVSDRFQGCYDELAGLIEQKGLGDSIEFTGYVPEDQLAKLYQNAGLFVLPSFDEGFGLPVLEAMACGTPVIASAGHALAEVMGDAGICVPASNPGALAFEIDRVVADPELQKRMSADGLRRASLFTWSQAALDLLQALGEARGLHCRRSP